MKNAIVKNAIKKTEDEYGCNVYSFVTDNCAAMVNMRKQVAAESRESNEDDVDNVISYGCGSHYLNLLAKDICSLPHNNKTIGVRNH